VKMGVWKLGGSKHQWTKTVSYLKQQPLVRDLLNETSKLTQTRSTIWLFIRSWIHWSQQVPLKMDNHQPSCGTTQTNNSNYSRSSQWRIT
jgi:hypothetical protein